MFGLQFYPTPDHLRDKMIAKLGPRLGRFRTVLDPSAGRGDLLAPFLEKNNAMSGPGFNVMAVEIDPDLRSVLKGRGARVIDSDWLTYSGMDQPDVIVMNPPFAQGARHLLKAIDILHSGEIVCILNAETITKPYTNERLVLSQRLEELGADIEFHEDEFTDADRTTNVKIALIHIAKESRSEEQDFSEGMSAAADTGALNDDRAGVGRKSQVTQQNSTQALVDSYNLLRDNAINLVLSFQNKQLPDFVGLSLDSRHFYPTGTKETVNTILKRLRKEFWQRVVALDSVQRFMTQEGVSLFNKQIEAVSDMDFTMENIKELIHNLRGSFSRMMSTSIVQTFDRMTLQHAWYPECKKNVHYFNGWATNDAFKVNKKVILPISCYCSILHRFGLEHRTSQELQDIEKTIGYFSDLPINTPLVEAIHTAVSQGETRNIDSTLFTVSIYKKGTIHLTFKDPRAIERFNYFVCSDKGWLPQDYGNKAYADMSQAEKTVVDSYEGEGSYTANANTGFYKSVVRVESGLMRLLALRAAS